MRFNWCSSDLLYQFELALKSSHRQLGSVFDSDIDNQYQFQNTLHNYGSLDASDTLHNYGSLDMSRVENTLHNYGLVDIDNQYQFQNTLHNYVTLDTSRLENTLHNYEANHE